MPLGPPDDNRKAALRNQIDENLRRIYDAALQEEVPESLKMLLQQLRDSTAAKKSAVKDHDTPVTSASDGSAAQHPLDSTESGV